MEKAGESRKSGPVSLCDLAQEEKLTQLHLVESNFVNLMTAHKHLKEVGCNLAFGLKLLVCQDMTDKSEASFKSESKVILFLGRDTLAGYEALIKLYSRAAQEGFYYVPRLDWKTLNEMWSHDLALALPFYSSFLARNTLGFCSIVPDLPAEPMLLSENNELPFDGLLDDAMVRYATANSLLPQPVKSVYYKHRADAKAFLVWRTILGRTSWDKPNQDGLCSREFAWEAFKELHA